jgi:uncharacterized protein involved in oxidation of intracellular sulfur
VRIFLLADAATCALAGQKTPDGYYNLERMLAAAIHRGPEVALCGSCMDARGIRDDQVIGGARRSNLEELTDWTLWADKVVAFQGEAQLASRRLGWRRERTADG